MAFEEFMSIVSSNEFAEQPAGLMEFVNGPDYLDQEDIELSVYQQQVIEKSTQIYHEDSLVYLYGEEEGRRMAKASVNEIICQIGKGGGKNFVSTISISYLIHKLLCLKDPHRYYGKPRGDSIDLINIAINAPQASNNFFTPFTTRLYTSPWFRDRISEKRKTDVLFDYNVHAHSGHSDREGMEGYNVIACVLDEISGFATEKTSGSGDTLSKTAEKIYEAYSASVTSRYPEVGKLIMLSFPRYKGDFISTRYNDVIATKRTQMVSQDIFRNEALPADAPGNKMTVNYEVDVIEHYSEERVFALRRPSHMFNPKRKITDYKKQLFNSPEDAYMRFFCMPPEAESAFFKRIDPLVEQFGEEALVASPFEGETWQLKPSFRPDRDKSYHIHVDIGYAHDRAALALCHVDKWVQQKNVFATEPVPRVVIDLARYWTPQPGHNVPLEEIKDYIFMLRSMGFHIESATFDQFESQQMIQELRKANIFSERLSVQAPHYKEFATHLFDGRIIGYREPELYTEFVGLRLVKGNKVDHPAKGSNDIADSVVGAVFNAVTRTPVPSEGIEVITADDFHPTHRKNPIVSDQKFRAPEPEGTLKDFFERMEMI